MVLTTSEALLTLTVALEPTMNVPGLRATVLEIVSLPPSMFQLPLTVKFEFEVSTTMAAAAPVKFEVISVAPEPMVVVKNELVAAAELLVTSKLMTPSVPLLKASVPLPVELPPTLSTPTLVTVPPVMVSTLLIAVPVPMVMFEPPLFQMALAKTVTLLLDEPLPMMLAVLAV